MHQTYELYLRDEAQGPPRFRPLTCSSPVEVMRRVREVLDEERSVASVEVRLAGQHLFTLDR